MTEERLKEIEWKKPASGFEADAIRELIAEVRRLQNKIHVGEVELTIENQALREILKEARQYVDVNQPPYSSRLIERIDAALDEVITEERLKEIETDYPDSTENIYDYVPELIAEVRRLRELTDHAVCIAEVRKWGTECGALRELLRECSLMLICLFSQRRDIGCSCGNRPPVTCGVHDLEDRIDAALAGKEGE